MRGLSFVTLLSYDYRLAFSAIRSYYHIADEIILGLDADRLTWAGNRFDIDMSEVHAQISRIDHQRKVRVIEENFHQHARPEANDTDERSRLSRYCRSGNWVVQIDCDEILLNADDFRRWMSEVEGKTEDVGALWLTVFKVFGEQALVVDPPKEVTPIGTLRQGEYHLCRDTGRPYTLSPLRLLHFSFGRSPEQVLQKLQNWSHSRGWNVDSFFKMWNSVTLENYQHFQNVHPLLGRIWPRLVLVQLPKIL